MTKKDVSMAKKHNLTYIFRSAQQRLLEITKLGHIFLFLCIFLSTTSTTLGSESRLVKQEQESRAQQVFSIVKCAVCSGQTIKDSNSEIALLMRNEIRRQISLGKTNTEIFDFLQAAYGEQILITTTFSNTTILLWLLPFFAILLSCISFYKRKFYT